MKASTKLLALALPIATVVTLTALVLVGATPQVTPTPDLIAYALELAPKTMYAIAIGGSTAVAMQLTDMNLGENERAKLIDRAADGEFGAILVLAGETFAWLAWAVLWSVVYL